MSKLFWIAFRAEMRRSATITNNFALSLGNCAAGRDLGRMLPREMFVAGI